jgi:hypothetical protein
VAGLLEKSPGRRTAAPEPLPPPGLTGTVLERPVLERLLADAERQDHLGGRLAARPAGQDCQGPPDAAGRATSARCGFDLGTPAGRLMDGGDEASTSATTRAEKAGPALAHVPRRHPRSLVLTHQRAARNARRYEVMDVFFCDGGGREGRFPAFAFIEPSYYWPGILSLTMNPLASRSTRLSGV